MAICKACKGNMSLVDGCGIIPVDTNDGKRHAPVRYKAEEGERCHDCNCADNHHHHPGCDMERCPVCHGQLISCGCLEEAEDNPEITDTQILEQIDVSNTTKQ
jgi:hypothetical protein